MKTHTLLALICLSLLAPMLFGQTNAVATPPAISEEARKHFVMGETMFKEAKSANDFSQAASQFSQAADLAPQWPEARYNLALAKEAAGDYAGAEADLKTYQQFKLSDAEARAAQDKIYAIEAKQQLKVSDAAAKAATDAANAQAADAAKKKAFLHTIQGSWAQETDTHHTILIQMLDDGEVKIVFDFGPNSSVAGQYLPITDISTAENTLRFSVNTPDQIFTYSLSANGNDKLTGTYVDYFRASASAYPPNNVSFIRQ
jgi:tetratricopeptide (TPR) repeat protein